MREILFRGKKKNGNRWYEGDFIHDRYVNTNKPVYSIWFFDLNDKPIQVNVDPETVGQYTGLKDKNGVKIFEGDIVRTQSFFDRPYSKKAKSKQHIGVVEYIAGDTGAEWRVRIEEYFGYGHCAFSVFYNCEVIGNIHDNKEILKEGGEE